MKRYVSRSIAFLLMGAIVNVSVAWAFARWHHPSDELRWNAYNTQYVYVADPFGGFTGRYYAIHTFRSRGLLRVRCDDRGLVNEADFRKVIALERNVSAVEKVEVPRWASAADLAHATTRVTVRKREDAFGWPALTLRCYYEPHWPSRGVSTEIVRDGLRLPDHPYSGGGTLVQGLPLRPIGSGFAINTLFYAAILWLLFAGLFAVSRSLRRQHNLCPACAYPVGESDVCTECGAPLKGREIACR